MSFEIKDYAQNFFFVPLGGCNEIGANLSVYHLDGKLLLVDMGIGFASDIPGVDMLIPDITFLRENRDKIVGLVVTHIHEDHCGSIEYLWNELRVPIFASRFTLNFIKSKLLDYDFSSQVKMTEIGDCDLLKLKPFVIKLVKMAHSTPESRAVFIQTAKGNVLHTGDWKFDENPNEVGEKTDVEYLKKLADEKRVDLLVCDSTNAITEGEAGSEGDLYESLKKIIGLRKGIVAVSTFASNVSRVSSLMKVAQEVGRKVVLSGFSVNRIVSVAKQSGYLEGTSKLIIPENRASRFKREELLFICTGCQGENNASTYKLSTNTHSYLKLGAGDTVIFSSKIIPGNEKNLFEVFNNFALKNVEVITEVEEFVHVSGHAKRPELTRMYNLVKPQKFIAVHGSPHQIMKNALLAKDAGVPDVMKSHNGVVIEIARDKPMQQLGLVDAKYNGLDGKRIIPLDNSIVAKRRLMLNSGAFFVSVVVNRQGKLLDQPVINAPGMYDFADDKTIEEILQEIVNDSILKGIKRLSRELQGTKNSGKGAKPQDIINAIREEVRLQLLHAAKNENGKKPEVQVVVHVLEN